MRNDFDLIVHEICEKEIKIYPVADVHFGALEHDTQSWVKFCSKVANEPNSYIILAGDLINNNTNSISHLNKLYFPLILSHVRKFFSNPRPDHDRNVWFKSTYI